MPFEKWRRDPKQNKAPVTVFSISPMGEPWSIAASVGPLVSLVDGPPQYARYIEARYISRRSVLGIGGRWPYWIIVVEGDHSGAPFPRDPDAFDAWFGPWAEENGISVIGDWRQEARRDGVRLSRGAVEEALPTRQTARVPYVPAPPPNPASRTGDLFGEGRQGREERRDREGL